MVLNNIPRCHLCSGNVRTNLVCTLFLYLLPTSIECLCSPFLREILICLQKVTECHCYVAAGWSSQNSSSINASKREKQGVVGLALTSSQFPTQLLSHSLPPHPLQQGKGRKEEKQERESLRVKIKIGKLLTNYCCRQNRLKLGKLIYCQLE